MKADEFGKYINEHVAFKAAADIKRNAIPQPDAYQVALPADWKPPEGVDYKPDPADPIYAHYRAFANKHGLDQDGFREGVGLLAAYEIQKDQKWKQWKAEQLQALGPNGASRREAVTTWWGAMVGDGGKGLTALLDAVPAVGILEGFEKLIKNYTSQGGASFSQAGRAAPAASHDIPGYDKMTFEQRRAEVDKRRAAANGAGR